MPGVYAAGAYHCAFAAKQAAFKQFHRLLGFAVLQGKDCASEAGPGELAGSAAGGAAAAGHAFEHIRFTFYQFGKSLLVCIVKVYP